MTSMNANSQIPIIIDIGTGEVKAGFNGQERPKILFKNQFGEPKYNKILKQFNKDNKQVKDIYIGEKCDSCLSALKLRKPVDHGSFTNSEDIIPIFNHIFSRLKLDSEEIKNHPILVSESLQNPSKNRENIASILFDYFEVPKLFFASQPILSLFATSNTTGAILESGEGVTQSCIVYEGYSIPCSFERYDYGGGDVTKYLYTLLQNLGFYFDTSAEYQIVSDIKEQLCFACPTNMIENIKKNSEFEKENYFLPDGNVIKLGEERILPPEILYNPELNGMEFPSFQNMILNSINKVDMELRPKLYESILLSGGNTSIKGTANKVYSEFKKLISQNMKIKIHSPKNPYLLCWIGGNIISGLEIFKKMWITKEEWNDIGENIVHDKTI
jgi:actin-related protein